MLCALVTGMIVWGAMVVVRLVGRPASLAATWDGASTGAAALVCPHEKAPLGAPVAGA